MTEYPMKRFPDLVEGKRGLFEPEGKEYGIGAFSWYVGDDGVRYLTFFRPDKVWKRYDGESIGPSTIPVNTGKWTWDGNEEKPTISPSILNKTIPPGHDDWVETFHGFVKGGVLQVLG